MSSFSSEKIMNMVNPLLEQFGFFLQEVFEGKSNCYVSLLYKSEKNGLLKIEQEKSYIATSVLIGESWFGLVNVIKFLKPDEVLRCNYHKRRDIKNYFVKDLEKYLFFYNNNIKELSEEKINSFYTKYPFYVWKWI